MDYKLIKHQGCPITFAEYFESIHLFPNSIRRDMLEDGMKNGTLLEEEIVSLKRDFDRFCDERGVMINMLMRKKEFDLKDLNREAVYILLDGGEIDETVPFLGWQLVKIEPTVHF